MRPVTDDTRWTRLAGARTREVLRDAGSRLAWLVIAVVLALGAAGVVGALDHPPGTPARAELTWAADEAVRAGLRGSAADLAAIADDVDKLGLQGRGALAALAASKWEILDQAIADGAVLVSRITARSDALRTRIIGLPGTGPNSELRLSPDTRARHAALLAAVDATDGLAFTWAKLSLGGSSGAQLSALLAQHDTLIKAAIDTAIKGNLKTAIAHVDEATDKLTLAGTMRDRLKNTAIDVTTLNEWLRRNQAYDVALRALYVASAASPGHVTQALRDAIAAEKAARAQLPGDTSGLVIIMAEIGRGGLNQAVIAIEEARGRLADAVAADAAPDDASASPPAP
jgi:hypothetical protein